MKKRIKKTILAVIENAVELKRKAQVCDLTEIVSIRILIHGFIPREQPDAKFHEVMQELSSICNNVINQLAAKPTPQDLQTLHC